MLEASAEMLNLEIVKGYGSQPRKNVPVYERNDVHVAFRGRESLPLEVFVERMTKSEDLADRRIEQAVHSPDRQSRIDRAVTVLR